MAARPITMQPKSRTMPPRHPGHPDRPAPRPKAMSRVGQGHGPIVVQPEDFRICTTCAICAKPPAAAVVLPCPAGQRTRGKRLAQTLGKDVTIWRQRTYSSSLSTLLASSSSRSAVFKGSKLISRTRQQTAEGKRRRFSLPGAIDSIGSPSSGRESSQKRRGPACTPSPQRSRASAVLERSPPEVQVAVPSGSRPQTDRLRPLQCPGLGLCMLVAQRAGRPTARWTLSSRGQWFSEAGGRRRRD
ncbi:unnamed protein product, partial [Polarella glacialis]